MTDSLATADLNILSSLTLVSALAESGVRDFVVSSGSRCAPLVLAVARHPGLRVLAQPDERSAGFLALGIAKASRRPAALICTSGTAAANYLPSVVEARLSHTPLIVLTADRPPELRGTGAPQTIDQVALYGTYPRYFCDLPIPLNDHSIREWQQHALAALAAAQGPPSGPVHLNVPFREPLIPDPAGLERMLATHRPVEGTMTTGALVREDAGRQRPSVPSDMWDTITSKLLSAGHGIIICGPQDSAGNWGTSLTHLAATLGFPILADIASQIRFGPHHDQSVFSHYDLCLRQSAFASIAQPDVVLRLGGLPTSKILNEWLAAASRHEHIIIEQHGEIADPDTLSTIRLTADLKSACDEIGKRIGSISNSGDYLRQWQQAEQQARRLLESEFEEWHRGFGGGIVRSVFRRAPAGTAIFLSNSMPIRWGEVYATGSATPLRVLCNRGANGIDGIVSTAAGVAAGLKRPIVLVVGDMAFMHDLNGLAVVRQYQLPLKIVLLNNDGGGIFSFLPIAAHQDVCDSLVAMPHGRDFGHAAAFWGIRHQRLDSVAAFDSAVSASFMTEGPEILEVKSTRDDDLAASREINRLMAEKLTGVS